MVVLVEKRWKDNYTNFQILKHKNNLFISCSASGCWTDFYAIGMLTFTGKNNLLDSSAWVKSATPVFKQSARNGVYAPGHNSFFKSPDGKEDWILYHANPWRGRGVAATVRQEHKSLHGIKTDSKLWYDYKNKC